MAFIGAKPTNVPLTANDITDGSISVAKLTSTLDLSSNTVTLPSGVGGKVLQVVTDDLTSEFTNSGSQTFTATGLTLNITPSATSSKIMLFASLGGAYINQSANRVIASFFRDSTNLGEPNKGNGNLGSHESDGRVIGHIGLSYLDSPSSTSQITYSVKVRLEDASGAGQISQNNVPSTITAMEIGA